MLRPIQELSKRSHEIGQGMFDTPDVDESRTDEIGDMAKAFNAMKRSMKRQVSLLEEQNRIKSALYQKETEALGLQNLLEKQKLQMLRSQVNPHFLFNTLNVLMYRAKEEHATSTAQMLRSLSTLYHYATTNNATQVPLSRESISDNFLMICFHLLLQFSSRCCLKSPVCHHGLLFTSCPVSVVRLLYIRSIVTECCTSQFCLLPESIIASAGKSSGGIVQARRSAKDIFLFRIMPCDDLLSFISDYKRPDGKCRILSCQNS